MKCKLSVSGEKDAENILKLYHYYHMFYKAFFWQGYEPTSVYNLYSDNGSNFTQSNFIFIIHMERIRSVYVFWFVTLHQTLKVYTGCITLCYIMLNIYVGCIYWFLRLAYTLGIFILHVQWIHIHRMYTLCTLNVYCEHTLGHKC